MQMFFIAFFFVLILSPIHAISSEEESKYLDETDDYLQKVAILIKEYRDTRPQDKLAEAVKYNNKAYETAKYWAEIEKAKFELSSVDTYGTRSSGGSSRRESDYFSIVDSWLDSMFVKICNNDTTIAKSFWKDLNKSNEAREQYRNILKKFKIDTKNEDLKICVKNAEVALEDMPSEPQQTKREIEDLKKENELLKKENELLKRKNEDLNAIILLIRKRE